MTYDGWCWLAWGMYERTDTPECAALALMVLAKLLIEMSLSKLSPPGLFNWPGAFCLVTSPFLLLEPIDSTSAHHLYP